jgi:hypothetical protein
MKKTDNRKKAFMGLTFLLAAGIVCAQEAVIREINGTVEVKTSGAWIPAQRGQELRRDTVISTGFKGSALIAIGNSTLTVQPLTRLSVEELVRAGSEEKVALNLRAGRIRADVKPPVGGTTEFTIRSPSATASVRGTSFEFDGIRLKVDEGRVHVSGGDRSGTYVGAGHQIITNIETGQTLSAAETAREELTPAMPAGTESVSEVVSVDIPSTVNEDVSSTGNIEIGLGWDKRE